MAVTYIQIQGTESATSRGQDIIDKIATEITALSNHWSVIQNGYTGQSGYYRTVLKCAMTGSGLSTDFYVTLYTQPANATFQHSVFMTLSEGYNTSTNTLEYYVMANHATDSLCRGGSSATLTTAIGGKSATASAVPAVFINPGNADYVGLFVYNDGILISSRAGNVNSSRAGYAGNFDSFVVNPSVNDPVTLGIIASGNTTQSTSAYDHWNLNANNSELFRHTSGPHIAWTRWAKNPSTAAQSNISGCVKMGSGYPQEVTSLVGYQNVTALGMALTDPYTGNSGFLSTPFVFINNHYNNFYAPYTNNASYGIFRGKAKYVLAGPTTSSWGDTLTIGDEVYMAVGTWVYSPYAGTTWALKEILV